MIAFDFEYIMADTIEEAVDVFMEIQDQGKKPLYYSGGTEIITMGRVNNLKFDAVIDIKGIPECNTQEVWDGKITLGAGITLKAVSMVNLYPMLTQAVSRIADHTAQCKITLGGNVAGTVIYKESVLPLLLADAEVLLAGPDGNRTVKLTELYNPTLQLKTGEFIVQFFFNEEFTKMPYIHAKHTNGEKIGYPLVTLCALRTNKTIKAAASGIQKYPSVLKQIKVNNRISSNLGVDLTKGLLDEMAGEIMGDIQQPLLTDSHSSGEFRQKVLRDSVLNMLERLVVTP